MKIKTNVMVRVYYICVMHISAQTVILNVLGEEMLQFPKFH